MLNYEYVKTELSKRRENTKHFTKKFFNDFVKAYQTAIYNEKHNINTEYVIDGIRLYHEFDLIYNSKFYQLNSGCYCEFLTIVHGKI